MEPQEEDPFLAGWASWMDQALPEEGAVVELSPELQAQEARLEARRAAPVPAIIKAARDGDEDASVVDAVVKAGADANLWREQRYGAPVTPIEWAIDCGDHRLWSILFRGGAMIPTDDDYVRDVLEDYTRHRAHPYLRKIETAGGWEAYEKAHRTKLLATFVPKFTHLVPKELVPLIVEFSFHVGFY